MASRPSAFETLIDRTRRLSESVLADTASQVDQNARWPEESIRALQNHGLAGLVVPVEYGGHGQGRESVARICEQLGIFCASTALCFGMHCVGTACLAAKPTEQQAHRWLEPIAAGEHLTTLALSEPGTGAHFYIPETRLLNTGGHYVVNGTKSFVTNGEHADSYVVSTVGAEEGTELGEFSCVAVPDDAEGLEWTALWKGIGMRGNAAATMELRDVRLPSDHLLGAEGEQIWYVFRVIMPYFLVAMSGTYLGIAERALREARDHLKQRSYSFGGTRPAHSSVVQRDLGRMWQRLESTRRLIYHAGALGDAGDDQALHTLMSAKAAVAHCAVELVNDAMTMVGGRGYADRSIFDRLLRDVRAAHVMAPTTQLLETWVGRSLLDLPILME